MIFNALLVVIASPPLLLGVNAMTNMAAAVAPYYKVPKPGQYSDGPAPVISGQEYGLPQNWQQLPAADLMGALQKVYNNNTAKTLNTPGKHSTTCTAENIVVRREWGALSHQDRLNYITAVKCLAKLPPKTPTAIAPGVRHRYDDFVIAHMLNTLNIHLSGYLLPWHRHLVYLFEKALRDECGYTGGQPYWDWAKYAEKPFGENPMFDGTETSFSGNGVKVPHNGSVIIVVPAGLSGNNSEISAPRASGSGGGCLQEGPFVDWVANLGPRGVLGGQAGPLNPRPDGLGYNPRCVIRDFAALGTLAATNSYQNLTDLILNHTSIHTFHPEVETNIHPPPHTFVGGLQSDTWASLGDPVFYLHHAQLDRVWSIWQSLDPAHRRNALDGTKTIMNVPPSANLTLADTIYMSPVFANVTVREVMSELDGPYCYRYE